MKVILNGYCSRTFHINADVIQRSILGTGVVSYLHQPSDIKDSQLAIYADAAICTCLNRKSDRSDELKLAAAVENEFQSFVNQGKKCLENLNASKTKLLTFNNHRVQLSLPPAWLMLTFTRATFCALVSRFYGHEME